MNRFLKVAGTLSLLFFASAADGQSLSGISIFGGYSYLSSDLNPNGRSNLNGWNASIEGRVLPFIGIVADFSGQYGGLNGVSCSPVAGVSIATCGGNVDQHNYLVGPRVSVSVGRFRPFAEALIGVSHVNGSALSTSNTSFSEAVGGGLDYRLAPFVSARLQVDFLQTRFFSATQNDVRISTGLVLRF